MHFYRNKNGHTYGKQVYSVVWQFYYITKNTICKPQIFKIRILSFFLFLLDFLPLLLYNIMR